MLRVISKGGLTNLTRTLSFTLPCQKKIPFILSDIGEGTKEVVIKEWYVTEGQVVEEFDELVEVQSDKATVPITSRYAGKIVKLYYEVDDMALVGKPLVDIDVDGDDAEPIDHFEIEEKKEQPIKAKASFTTSGGKGGKPKAKPAVRKFAKEHGVNLSDVIASDPNGIITKQDVQDFLKDGKVEQEPVVHATSPVSKQQESVKKEFKVLPTKNFTTTSAGERRVALGPIAKAMTKSMNEANKIPHFGYKEEYDLSNLVKIRTELKPIAAEFGIQLSYMPFIIKAVSLALNDYPILNSSMSEDETELIYHEDHNIGIATDTPHGLMVPNIKSVHHLSVLEIAVELNRLHLAGMQNKLTPKDIKMGTFSLSNIGSIGGTYAKPVIVPPQVAIGALGRIQKLPRFNENDVVEARHIMCISWSADHRCIEGAVMARFSNKLKMYLEQPAGMLLHTR